MEKIFLTAALLFLNSLLFSQDTTTPTEFNLDFEKLVSGEELPTGWFRWGDEQFELIPDSTTIHSGKMAVLIQPKEGSSATTFGCVAYRIPAQYKANKIEVKAYMKLEDVTDPIGLMIRVDGKSGVLSFDNMQKRGIKGTSDWNQYAVKVSYPDHAQNIFIGAILSGKGKLWVDNFEVLLDGKNCRTRIA
ncbi:hypothetical protein [Chondrinema litorale]|uniref:hypothetical protein n=1 Tax=Chondrinema litorale TaxID=2994555 RepID=UPI002542A5A4|nr:hypothetical protein [Chondrinema litorale]UZR98808.1 hypothetical protein OQ292_33715 [Chondrinema litorale]